METWLPADEGGWQVPTDSGSPDAVERRLAAIEARLDGLERSIQDAVAAELQNVSEDLRRTVSQLGRLLLRDLDRLTKVLADHRDAIVDRLQALAAAEAAQAGAAAVVAAVETGETVETGEGGEAVAGAEAGRDGHEGPDAMTGEAGRWRALPGRRKRRASGAATAADGDDPSEGGGEQPG